MATVLLILNTLALLYLIFIKDKPSLFSFEWQYIDYENNKYRHEVYLKEKYLFTIPITFTHK